MTSDLVDCAKQRQLVVYTSDLRDEGKRSKNHFPCERWPSAASSLPQKRPGLSIDAEPLSRGIPGTLNL